MKPLSILALVYGLLLVVLGSIGATLIRPDDSFINQAWSKSLSEQGTSLERWSLHWNGTCTVFVLVGVFSISIGVAIWRSSRTAAALWLALIVCTILVQFFLFACNPLPFAFQQVDIIDIGIQFVVLALSVLLCTRSRRQREATKA